jgi:hypothetical protein
MKKEVLLIISLLSFSEIVMNGQEWTGRAHYSYYLNYEDAYVVSNNHEDQFGIRFFPEGKFEFYFVTDKNLLKNTILYLVFDNESSLTGVTFSSHINYVEDGFYWCKTDGNPAGMSFNRTIGVEMQPEPYNDNQLLILFKTSNLFKIILSTSNDNFSKRYEIPFTLKMSSLSIEIAQKKSMDLKMNN